MPKNVQSEYIDVTLITCGVCFPENHCMSLKFMEQKYTQYGGEAAENNTTESGNCARGSMGMCVAYRH
jgi:hypothetical protein